MQSFTVHRGLVAPLERSNVDTDAIIPKQFLKSIKRSGFGPNLFDEWRYLDAGESGQDVAERRPNPDFVLNQARYQGASILLVGENFGCGSSREHAPWAILQYGFRAIIAPSFADIFYNNCFKNGLLPLVLGKSTVLKLFDEVKVTVGMNLTVDLTQREVRDDANQRWPFDVDGFRQKCLINGWDEIGLSLKYADAIRSYECKRLATMPWLDDRII